MKKIGSQIRDLQNMFGQISEGLIEFLVGEIHGVGFLDPFVPGSVQDFIGLMAFGWRAADPTYL
jgi:hypothetical protein